MMSVVGRFRCIPQDLLGLKVQSQRNIASRCISRNLLREPLLQYSNAGTRVTLNFSRNVHRSSVLQSSQVSISYDCSKSDHTLSGATIGQLFNQQVESTPDRDMIVFTRDKQRLTFEQVKSKVDKMVHGFLKLGLKPGDRVGIWSPNQAEWVITQMATAQIGLILVNINPAYRVKELEYALKKVGVKCLVMAQNFKTQDYYEMMFELCPELARCQPGELKSHLLPELRTVILAGNHRHPGVFLFDDLLAMGGPDEQQTVESIAKKLTFDQPINIQFTSGTTGNPKGATLTHHNLINNARFVGLRMGYDKQKSIICVAVPLYHCFGMVCGSMVSIVLGATCVYPSPSFEPEASLIAIHEERCNLLYGTPTMFIDILNHPNRSKYDYSSLNSGIMAGSPCPSEVMKQLINDMDIPDVCVAYGSTETSPVTFLTHPSDPVDKRCGSIGCLLDHTEAKIVNSEGEIVPRGEQGELCTRGYSTMLGYWDDKTKTEGAISPSRWYHTGDIGLMHDDGYVMLNGRIKDMLIRGGENIYPVEIEQFLYTHPSIEDVQVIGVPDKRMGEEICAAVRVKPDHSLTEQEVKDFCKGQSYPLTVTGKVQKYVMRQDLVKQLNLEHEAP